MQRVGGERATVNYTILNHDILHRCVCNVHIRRSLIFIVCDGDGMKPRVYPVILLLCSNTI